MKILIVSDLHGEHPKGLVEQSLEDGVECFAFLGDYDTPQVVDYLMNLEVPDKIVLIGNHDYYHARGEILECRDFDSRAWQRYQDAREFIERWSQVEDDIHFGLKATRTFNNARLGFVHASLQPQKPDSLKLNYLWGNLDTPCEQVENLREMSKLGLEILFRGHEHIPYVLSISAEQDLNGQGLELEKIAPRIKMRTPGFNKKLRLSSDEKCIVSTPAFKYGGYTIFETTTRELEFFERKK